MAAILVVIVVILDSGLGGSDYHHHHQLVVDGVYKEMESIMVVQQQFCQQQYGPRQCSNTIRTVFLGVNVTIIWVGDDKNLNFSKEKL